MSRAKPPAQQTSPAAGLGRTRGQRRARDLREEEARLWAEVTKGLEPLRRRAGKPGTPLAASAVRPPDEAPAAASGAAPTPPPTHQSKTSLPRHGMGSHATLPVGRRIPDLAGFTRRDMRQLTTGRLTIEARLDLHGLRQAEAHMALRGFLVQCQDQGLKHVLVITGKGSGYNREEALFGDSEPGVLRRLVPIWLAEQQLRTIVTGFNEAPLRHGGVGALYVRLRGRRDA